MRKRGNFPAECTVGKYTALTYRIIPGIISQVELNMSSFIFARSGGRRKGPEHKILPTKERESSGVWGMKVKSHC